ncbi:dihydrolipoyl dehydrogenase [Ignatzschineria rhizosphaerae]|uniref:Dihydrolipoyl dehydrogenase n=1 Tax=Ignatzschineria rhizosphaerae TaxID=2923279 RepID=A0ABY3X0Z8_9GAMM|nr:dihydrolipoyl dehydrogenase [Ignatzschineria rhizosphaerae]UNM95560.1 dihydrolipoyl dehydrogenase [Ignatzschineria rhizosphaerae]
MAAKEFDVIVIGGGPAGYVNAIRAAQLGLKTACVEKWIGKSGKPALGGTCLNVGCIPSKALLESSALYVNAKDASAEHGITVGDIKMDPKGMIERKDKIVTELTSGIAMLFQANKVEWLQGAGKLLKDNVVEVTDHEGKVATYKAKDVVLATGSVPMDIPSAVVDNKRIIDSEGALNLTEVPKRLGVIGAGVIGLEMASVWSRLGSEVVIFEAMDNFLSAADQQIAKDAAKHFKKQGLDIRLGAKVTESKASAKDVVVKYADKDGDHEEKFDYLLVAVGRKAFTDGIVDEAVGLEMDGRLVKADDNCKTNIANVWAIGDLVRGPMLAHKGSAEGIAVAQRIAGQYGRVNYDAVPWVIYTHPEIAWAGKTQEQCKADGIDVVTSSFPFAASGRAKAMGATEGLVKVIADAKTDKLLGVHIVGANASELIHEAVIVLEFGGTSEDLASTMHAHPTLAESVMEAAHGIHKSAIHMMNRK